MEPQRNSGSARPSGSSRPFWSRVGAALPWALLAVLSGHLCLVAYFAPRATLFSDFPVMTDALGIEGYRVVRMQEAFRSFGRGWMYDPAVLAGQTCGFVARLGTRLFLLGVPALVRFGVSAAHAFDALVVALHVLFPLLGYGASRAFGASRRAATLTVALWSLLWFFDSLFHAAWFLGRGPFVFGSGVALVSAGSLGRTLSRGHRLWALLAGALLGVALLVHPMAGLFAAATGAVAALGARGILPSRRVPALLSVVLPLAFLAMPGGVAVSLSAEPVSEAFRVAPSQLLWDAIDVLGPTSSAPGVSRTMIRMLCLAAGVLSLRRSGTPHGSFTVLILIAVSGLLAGYVGGASGLSFPIDPYLFVVPATLAASIPAAVLLAELPYKAIYERAGPPARVAFAVSALVIVPRAFRTVASYVPELLPERVVRVEGEERVSPLFGLNDPMPSPLRHEPPGPRLHTVARFLAEHGSGRGRILVDDGALAALLAVTTRLPVIGPLGERGSPSRDADPSRFLGIREAPTTSPPASPEPGAVAAFLERYAVGWVALGGRPSVLDSDDPLLEPPLDVAGFRVRRVVREPSFFAEGAGRVEIGRATIRAFGVSGPRVTLRFHFDPRLACRPDCRVEPEALAFRDQARGSEGTAPFISVPSPPAVFELYAP